jgi:3-deoxy-7-phosphoheptulonate synthase
MSGSESETIIIAVFEADVPPATVHRMHDLLGMNNGPDPRVRFHSPKLATFRTGGVDQALLDCLRCLPGVRKITELRQGTRLAGRQPGQARQPVVIRGGVTFGDGSLSVIAGPCSVESREQILEGAEYVASAGAKALRGGVFKPRTSPYMFGGLGERGLEYLALARERTGLPIVTEVLCVTQVELVSRYADVLQIGSRNMTNFPLLWEVGANSRGLPVLLKRGLAATLSEYLDAAEYVLLGRLSTNHAEPGVILCERGIRTYAPSVRFTLDIGAVPALREATHLPVIVDPSHAAGKRSLVPALARAAIAAGANGLLIETQVEPDRAWCDGEQCIDAGSFRTLMRDIQKFVSSEVPVE